MTKRPDDNFKEEKSILELIFSEVSVHGWPTQWSGPEGRQIIGAEVCGGGKPLGTSHQEAERERALLTTDKCVSQGWTPRDSPPAHPTCL